MWEVNLKVKTFKPFLENYNINHNSPTLIAPQENDVVEKKKKKSLQQMARMILNANLLQSIFEFK